jgi:uncharacterized protein (DUF302 family)
MSVEGLRVIRSRRDPGDTLARAETAIGRHNLKIFACIDHGAEAEDAGVELRPTLVLIFGRPSAGAATIQAAQTLAIDLPMKLLIWQDAQGQTSVAYNDPDWVWRRHGISDDATVEVMREVLSNIAGEAAG